MTIIDDVFHGTRMYQELEVLSVKDTIDPSLRLEAKRRLRERKGLFVEVEAELWGAINGKLFFFWNPDQQDFDWAMNHG